MIDNEFIYKKYKDIIMKILILDVYPDVDYRISKDQNGGYGTANDYGKTLLTKFLKFVVNS